LSAQAGQAIGAIESIVPAAQLVKEMMEQFVEVVHGLGSLGGQVNEGAARPAPRRGWRGPPPAPSHASCLGPPRGGGGVGPPPHLTPHASARSGGQVPAGAKVTNIEVPTKASL
jgi:hypothetical protein